MSLRMKSVSVALVLALLVFLALPATSEPVEAAGTVEVLVGASVVVGIVALTIYLFNERQDYVDRAMDSWIGRSVDELVLTWGPPSHSGTLPGGQDMIAYTSVSTHVSPGTSTTRVKASAEWDWETRTTVSTPSTITEEKSYRMFLVNDEGIIESVSWEGLGMDTPEAP